MIPGTHKRGNFKKKGKRMIEKKPSIEKLDENNTKGPKEGARV